MHMVKCAEYTAEEWKTAGDTAVMQLTESSKIFIEQISYPGGNGGKSQWKCNVPVHRNTTVRL